MYVCVGSLIGQVFWRAGGEGRLEEEEEVVEGVFLGFRFILPWSDLMCSESF